MKHFTFTAIFATLSLLSTAQVVTVDFESLTLPAVYTFNNGADQTGYFQTQGARFTNQYTVDPVYGDYASGFAYSNGHVAGCGRCTDARLPARLRREFSHQNTVCP